RYFFLIPTKKFQEKISAAFKPLKSRFIPFGHPTDMQHIALEQDIPIILRNGLKHFSIITTC
ncbi:MAG: hypothetical protein IJ482_05670, partial [Alphaproteobacteria bacterium]|nr:hypothetical protein [Alphaproteobacteria bacterium]